MRRLLACLLASLLLLVACADDRVTLAYELEPGRQLQYQLRLRAEIIRTIGGVRRSEDVEATFLSTQVIGAPLATGGAEATVTLVPESLAVDGRPVDVGAPQEFVVNLGEDGRVLAIQKSGAADAEALDPVGIERLLPRLRPVLPGTPVTTGQTWASATILDDESGRFSLSSRSRLAQLGLAGGREAALVRTTYVSPVDRQEEFANAVAEMEGRDIGAQEAWFALDGFLISAEGDSVGTYGVTFTPPGSEAGLGPVQGSLVVRLHTEMLLLSGV